MIWQRAASLLGIGAIAGAGAAWVTNTLEPYGMRSPLINPAAFSDAAPEAAKSELSELTREAEKPGAVATPPVAADAGQGLAPGAPPAFDIVRVQPDGSLVLAGRAAPGATIDIVARDRVIGSTSSDESGAFAFVLDQPLAPGDYEIGLVAKVGDEKTASAEKAVVQIPDKPDGAVLAIVTTPGEPSRVVDAGIQATVAEPASADEQAAVAATTAKPEAPAAEPVQGEIVTAMGATDAPQVGATVATTVVDPVAAEPAAPVTEAVRVEAVEIDGGEMFVAGVAPTGATLRVYLGETALGDAVADAQGRFLLKAARDVAIGQHQVRVDQINPATGEVTARAAVTFDRADEKTFASVADPAKPQAVDGLVALPLPGEALSGAPVIKVDTSVIIRKGDTLWQIARRVYGKGVSFSTIYSANASQIKDPNRIWPGQVFKMPETNDQGGSADFGAIGDQKKLDTVLQ
jgi:nucleoid-associated protein YgaU